MAIRFDLITVDVVEPRETAAAMIAKRPSFEIELDEDDGRWLVVASRDDGRRFGLQRSDRREVAVRGGSIVDVVDGSIELRVPDPALSAAFFSESLGLELNGDRIEFDGAADMRWRAGALARSNLHLDFACDPDQFGQETERLLDLGATRIGPLRLESWGTSQIFVGPGGVVFCLNGYRDQNSTSAPPAAAER